MKTLEQKKRYAEKNRLRRLKWVTENGPCKICGSNKELQVDHIDPTGKVHHAIWSWRQERIDNELLKCQVLCRKCHEAKTAEEFRRPNQHGCAAGYNKRACRCAECKLWHANQQSKWRKTRLLKP